MFAQLARHVFKRSMRFPLDEVVGFFQTATNARCAVGVEFCQNTIYISGGVREFFSEKLRIGDRMFCRHPTTTRTLRT